MTQLGKSIPVQVYLSLIVQNSIIEGILCVIDTLTSEDSPTLVPREKVGIS
jgi:hypothetical protein